MSKGNPSSHLSKSEQEGYIKVQKEFVDKIPRTLMSLSKKGEDAFNEYKEKMMNLLSGL
ncbi:MAG: transcriptional regulator [Clostridiales bacterium]|nr:transcriptional regulator [Clostridiales bacterium]